MLKFPTLAELRGLFFRPTRLAQATAGIARAITDAVAVAASLRAKAERAFEWGDILTEKANEAKTKGYAFEDDANHAARVASRLSGLIA